MEDPLENMQIEIGDINFEKLDHGQKYILAQTDCDVFSVFTGSAYEMHYYIASKQNFSDEQVLGGGYIAENPDEGIVISGASGDFGALPEVIVQKIRQLIINVSPDEKKVSYEDNEVYCKSFWTKEAEASAKSWIRSELAHKRQEGRSNDLDCDTRSVTVYVTRNGKWDVDLWCKKTKSHLGEHPWVKIDDNIWELSLPYRAYRQGANGIEFYNKETDPYYVNLNEENPFEILFEDIILVESKDGALWQNEDYNWDEILEED